ncbi:hypothetical protein [Vibrio parahaemolyticus]|uniref:hypothetical protein n=1 Tax=Vibrio parahaemolyticus TaxID=670 RepID=UPI00111E60B1|nr:hypothetical protein [Vibrio parahaemolyticus]TOG94867.1 hypothetical protein CGI92_14865 [Vibrio parahaemolyticus]
MSKLDAIINILQIRENASSKQATHYHLVHQCYLYLDTRGTLHHWDASTHEWTLAQTSLKEEQLVICFDELESCGFCRIGSTSCQREGCHGERFYSIDHSGALSLDCDGACAISLELPPGVWDSVKSELSSCPGSH